MWTYQWEFIGEEHSDLFGSGYEGYETVKSQVRRPCDIASKRHQRQKGCETKIRFPTPDSAYCALRKSAKQSSNWDIVKIYHCQFCHGLHFGRPMTNHKRTRTNMHSRPDKDGRLPEV
jgi:hypothetical protein